MKNKKKVIIISIVSAALIAVTIIIALFSGCSKNTSTPDEATADTATSDTATIETTTLNIEAQAITDNGLSIDKDGNVIDKDGKKVEPSEDGKVKIKTDDGKTVEVSADDIKKADSKTALTITVLLQVLLRQTNQPQARATTPVHQAAVLHQRAIHQSKMTERLIMRLCIKQYIMKQ